MISVSNLRWNDFRLKFETEIIPSLFRDGNRDRIIFVSNQRPKNPSLIRDGIFGLYFRLYLETEIETE